MGLIFMDTGHYEEAQLSFERSIALAQQVKLPGDEIAGLAHPALLFYRHLNRHQEAITTMEQALSRFNETGLMYDTSGMTADSLRHALHLIRTGILP